MIEIVVIGLAAMVALIWLLAFSMATESAGEKRQRSSPTVASLAGEARSTGSDTKHAA